MACVAEPLRVSTPFLTPSISQSPYGTYRWCCVKDVVVPGESPGGAPCAGPGPETRGRQGEEEERGRTAASPAPPVSAQGSGRSSDSDKLPRKGEVGTGPAPSFLNSAGHTLPLTERTDPFTWWPAILRD